MKHSYSKWQSLVNTAFLAMSKQNFIFPTFLWYALSEHFPKKSQLCECQWSNNYDKHFWVPNQNNTSCRTALLILFCKHKFITSMLLLKTKTLHPFHFLAVCGVFLKLYEALAINSSTEWATCPLLFLIRESNLVSWKQI